MRLNDEIGGRYRLQKGPMTGGSGEVWLAHDRELGRNVALKRARREDHGEDAFARMRSEARALAGIHDPHVVTLYDTLRTGEGEAAESWLVMEYAPGGSLDGRQLPAEQVARIGVQICRGLAALHAKGIVHCDIKPGNIVLGADGIAKLTDLDSAHRVGGSETISPTRPISYTPDYAAPEVVKGNPVPASDLFSLGATLYELVVGKPPRAVANEGDDEGDERIRVWTAGLGAVRLDGATSGPLAPALAAMLQPAARERPDAHQARELLESATEPTPHRFTGPLAILANHPLRTAGTAAVAVVVAGALAVTSVFWNSERGGHPAERALGGSDQASQIGNPRTADPCALTEPSALGRFGDTELDKDYGNYDRCDVLVYPDEDSEVDVIVGFDNGPASELAAPTRKVGKIGIVEEPAEGGECDRTLLPAGDDSTVITVTARGDGRAPFCQIADVATDSAAAALGKGKIARRSPVLPTDSLVWRDTCTLLDAKALKAVPGLGSAEPDTGYGGWSCGWDGNTSDLSVDLTFDRGQSPTVEEDGDLTKLDGYDSFVQSEGEGEETCLVQVVYRSYADQNRKKAVEKLSLVVSGSRSPDQLCESATDLARSAAAELRSGKPSAAPDDGADTSAAGRAGTSTGMGVTAAGRARPRPYRSARLG